MRFRPRPPLPEDLAPREPAIVRDLTLDERAVCDFIV